MNVDCLVSVDCTDISIKEPRPFSTSWFSHKLNGPGLRYEVAVSLKDGNIVWINGPFMCGLWPDLKIFRRDLQSFLDPNERVEADDGYKGEPKSCKTPSEMCSMLEGRRFRQRVRARHETINARLKKFGILEQRYRHNILQHGVIFRAVAVMIQLEIESGHPLFSL